MKYTHPDLHLHSNVSDGSDTPLELLENVRKTDIDIFSLTDHDTVLGCEEIQKNLRPGDPTFLEGIELSCNDSFGKSHILGYCYNPKKASIRSAAEVVHQSRRSKALNRLRFLEETCHFTFSEEEKNRLLQNENPGRPHFVALLLEKGYVASREEGFALMAQYHGKERKLTAEEAIDAILQSDGIPVLAHGILEDGSGLLTEEKLAQKVAHLKSVGLMGMECYYSSFTQEQTAISIRIAEANHLLITAGSDYHGKNKTVPLGFCGTVKQANMERFYQAIHHLLGY